MGDGDKAWLSTQEAAGYIGYSVKSLTRFCRQKLIRYARVGGRSEYRFKKLWLDEFMESGTTAPRIDTLPARRPLQATSPRDPGFAAMVARKKARQQA